MVEMNKIKVVYITGSRADFGRAYYILKRINENPRFDLHILATCMHLSPEFGYTLKEIEKHFQVVEKVDMLLSNDSEGAMAKSFGMGIIEITHSLERIMPNLVMVLGDRGEMLAGAISSQHLRIPVAHIGGGHVSGSIDDRIRDAITIFSDLHFVANENCKRRVISLGANPANVHVVGAPDLEAIARLDFLKPEKVIQQYCIDPSKPLILLSYHPSLGECCDYETAMKIVCASVLEFKNAQIIATYPNADSGGRRMIAILKECSKNPNFNVYVHISYRDYLGLMNIASVLVGNSSAGIIEAASFGLPAVNIGSRQKGREKAENVIDARCDKKEIVNAIATVLYDEEFKKQAKKCKNPYGDGRTSERVVKVLESYFLEGGKSD
jgi:UDP-N-acetylglucosamine 2-epimerase (non-hydrolysing)/GDP/UDP-N,N'-diacetylbacillosamine 2-epimerase (hydrolysing)